MPPRRLAAEMGGLAGVARVAMLAIAIFEVAGCAAPAAGSPVPTGNVDLPPSYRFAPAAITVPAGTTVTWTNHDHFSHSVQFLDGGLPGAPMTMDPGAAATFTFAAAGLFHYQCSFHPQNMTGSVLVTP